MITTVQKWGNSQGLRLSRQLLSDLNIRVGDSVDVTVREGEIVIRPVRRTRGKYDLEDLVKRIPTGHETEEVDWGEPAGKEVW
jgi:antitoxin MazE